MILYPETQKRAQEELDAVLGPDRLPEFDDFPSLPYVEALVMEILRWHPVVPIGKISIHSFNDLFNNPAKFRHIR